MSSFSFSSLLRNRAAVIQAIVKREVTGSSPLVMLAFAILAIALYGGVMGSFVRGDVQVWLQHSAKLLKILMGSFLLSLPSLYIFSAFRGSKLTLGQLLMLSIAGFGTLGLVLIGFLPIAWFFTWISETVIFIQALHVVMIVVAWLFLVIVIGQGLNEAYRWAEKQSDKNAHHGLDIYALWVIVLLVVTIQMTAHLTPYFVHDVPIKNISSVEKFPADQMLTVQASVTGKGEDSGDLSAEYTREGRTLLFFPRVAGKEQCYEFSDYQENYTECVPANTDPNVSATIKIVQDNIEGDFFRLLPFLFKDDLKSLGEPLSREKVNRSGGVWWKTTWPDSKAAPGSLTTYEEDRTGIIKEIELRKDEELIMRVSIQSIELRPRIYGGPQPISLETWKQTLPYPTAAIQPMPTESTP